MGWDIFDPVRATRSCLTPVTAHHKNNTVMVILKEVMEIGIEDNGVENMKQSIQYAVEEVKYLQLLRSHVILSFEKEIVQVVTETRSVLYEMASTEKVIEID
jgi:hypothetical protein